jgi:hypothetical protein
MLCPCAKKEEIVLRNLRSLSLDLHCAPVVAQLSLPAGDNPSQTMFPVLAVLKIVSCSGDGICGCIPQFMSDRITSLTLTLSNDITSPIQFKNMVNSFGRLPSSKLKQIKLSEKKGRKVNIKDPNALGPLLSLPIDELQIDLSSIAWPFGSLNGLLMSALLVQIKRPLTIRSITFPLATDAGPFILPYLADIATQLPMVERLAGGIHSTTQISTGIFKWGTFPEISGLLHHWKTSQPPSRSSVRHLAIYEQKPLTDFNIEQYNGLAQLLDLMFPQLISIEPYTEADRAAPYWKNHWWFIEHLRKMYKRLRVYETAGSGAAQSSICVYTPRGTPSSS